MKQKAEILEKAAKIKLVIFDVDGVLTDGRLYFAPNGDEYKVFHVHDGLAIKLLQQTGIVVAIISSRESAAVTHRMHNLGVQYCYQGQIKKTVAFEELLTKLQLCAEQVAYIGDDLPDLALIQRVGLGICVPNAHPLLKNYAVWQTTALGGQGVAREVCELILQAQGALEAVYKKFI